ncbi:mechanosensitive ion channel [Roseicyclus sp. F158]|uniref:Mechanosensitive ion channel n=1 Tax=Tropicimonas omnivorans TaxID=3075590 RepID=A0ABU3DCE6_9RHOB|nr:mechanosensitive ion channel domain-containing protein [Roseicyclus sp. F158]MDT0681386.1 mechanosensitive ion channel [Roseicyclus sp. F158]
MDSDFSRLLLSAWSDISGFAGTLTGRKQLYQLGLIALLALIAQLIRMWLSPRMRSWMRTLEGETKWRLRVLLTIQQRIRIISFVAMIYIANLVVAEISPWPSSRYLLELAASIATAWLVVGFAARLIRNVVLRRLVAWGAWIVVTLYYLGLLDVAASVLDGMALEFGQFRLSLLMIVKAVAIVGLLIAAARFVAGAISGRIRRNEEISPSMQVLAVKFLQVALYGAAFFIGLKAVGFDLTGLAVLSGAIGVGLGFGLQKVVSNLVSGIIILLDKSIKPGDVITVGNTFGWINSLGARYVSITTRDGKEYLIPNEDLITQQVVNWSHTNNFVRLDVYFGVSYGDDPHLVRRLAIEAASRTERVISARPPVCHIVGFGDSSVDYILRFWIMDPTGGLTNIRGNVFLALWDAFKDNGITIPFPQREVRVLEGSTLRAKAGDGAGEGAGPARGGALD